MRATARTLLLLLVLVTGLARAQTSNATAHTVARTHFQDGLARAQRGELEAALRHFRAAYDIQPHYSVLYNIGQAEATLGRPIEAVDAFERYLRDGGDQIGPERRHTVLQLIAANRQNIGQLRLIVAAPDRMRIWLDGVEIKREQLSEIILLKTGEHTLMHSGGAGFPVSQRISITSTGVAEVRIEVPSDTLATPGQLAISCVVPGVAVDISGGPHLVTPVKVPVVLPAGTITVRFSRPGYRPMERVVSIKPQQLTEVDCAQQLLPRLPGALSAKLALRVIPDDAKTFVDGQPFRGAPLPSGMHDVQIARDGFVPLRTTVSLTPGTTRKLEATLVPTRARVERQTRARARRRTIAYVVGGTSAALLLTSGSLFLWNNRRYEKFEQGRAGSSGAPNLELATSIQRIDDLSFGLAIGGVIGGAVSVWSFSAGEDD